MKVPPSGSGRPQTAARARIEEVNRVHDEVHATFGGHRVDLAARPDVFERAFWAVDRLHPSELGHRALGGADGVGGDPPAPCRDP